MAVVYENVCESPLLMRFTLDKTKKPGSFTQEEIKKKKKKKKVAVLS